MSDWFALPQIEWPREPGDHGGRRVGAAGVRRALLDPGPALLQRPGARHHDPLREP